MILTVCSEKLDNHWLLEINGRPMTVPGTADAIVAPSPLACQLLLCEWQGLLNTFKEKPAPLSSMIFKASTLLIKDKAKPAERNQIVGNIMKYLNTDSICYFETTDRECRSNVLWSEVIKRLEAFLNVRIQTTTGFQNIQPLETTNVIKNILHELGPFDLVAVETQTRLLKSALLPLALKLKQIDLPSAIDCALAESDSQEERWGTIPETHSLNRAVIARNSALASLLMQ